MHYDVVTREYNVSCTVGKAATLTHFEDLLMQYEPMISASIRNLNIFRDHEQYKQAGRIALWQAWQRFDEEKGNFTPFAFKSIRGAMLDEMKKENYLVEHNLHAEEELLEIVDERSIFVTQCSTDLQEALSTLSTVEQQLLHALFIEGITLAECAAQANISIPGIKKRRERALLKLRDILQ